MSINHPGQLGLRTRIHLRIPSTGIDPKNDETNPDSNPNSMTTEVWPILLCCREKYLPYLNENITVVLKELSIIFSEHKEQLFEDFKRTTNNKKQKEQDEVYFESESFNQQSKIEKKTNSSRSSNIDETIEKENKEHHQFSTIHFYPFDGIFNENNVDIEGQETIQYDQNQKKKKKKKEKGKQIRKGTPSVDNSSKPQNSDFHMTAQMNETILSTTATSFALLNPFAECYHHLKVIEDYRDQSLIRAKFIQLLVSRQKTLPLFSFLQKSKVQVKSGDASVGRFEKEKVSPFSLLVWIYPYQVDFNSPQSLLPLSLHQSFRKGFGKDDVYDVIDNVHKKEDKFTFTNSEYETCSRKRKARELLDTEEEDNECLSSPYNIFSFVPRLGKHFEVTSSINKSPVLSADSSTAESFIKHPNNLVFEEKTTKTSNDAGIDVENNISQLNTSSGQKKEIIEIDDDEEDPEAHYIRYFEDEVM